MAAVRHFLAHGAAPCQPDAFGQSPAHLAAKVRGLAVPRTRASIRSSNGNDRLTRPTAPAQMGRSDALAALGTVCPGVVDRAGLEARDLLPPPVRPGLPVAWPGGLPGTTRPDDLAEVGQSPPLPNHRHDAGREPKPNLFVVRRLTRQIEPWAPRAGQANRLARADAERSGWRQSGRWDAVLEGGRCDLPTVDGALSPEEFERFVLAQRPVRMKGAAKDW